jgi:hypothetical protein
MPVYLTLVSKFRINKTLPSSGLSNKTESSDFFFFLCNLKARKSVAYTRCLQCGNYVRNTLPIGIHILLFSVYHPNFKQTFISVSHFMLRVHRGNIEWIKSETSCENTLYKAASCDKFPFHLRTRQATVSNWTETLKMLQPARSVCRADSLPSQ